MTRSEYVSHIWEYKKRRNVVAKRIIADRKQVTQLQKKINRWANQIKIIDKRNDKIKSIDNAIKDFLGVSVKGRGIDTSSKNTHLQLAKKIFYKYGIEQGINGAFLCKYTDTTNPYSASRSRILFTQSFQDNKENSEMYHRFLAHLKRH